MAAKQLTLGVTDLGTKCKGSASANLHNFLKRNMNGKLPMKEIMGWETG